MIISYENDEKIMYFSRAYYFPSTNKKKKYHSETTNNFHCLSILLKYSLLYKK